MFKKKDCVLVDLQGGIGNQLFCYSAGYYVAKKTNQELTCVMTTEFNSTDRDSQSLLSLNLPGEFTRAKTSLIKNSLIQKVLLKVSEKLSKHFPKQIRVSKYHSKTIGFDPILDQVSGPIHLHGYFQSWHYPAIARDSIRDSISEISLGQCAKELMSEVKNGHNLIIHIRLGDYLKPENAFLGVLHPEYYKAVLNHPNMRFDKVYVFSDEIKLAKREYSYCFPADTIWADEKKCLSPLETLIVMSNGKLFAIANSTFSWWAAFLSRDPHWVLAPNKWFKLQSDPGELYPPSWATEESVWR